VKFRRPRITLLRARFWFAIPLLAGCGDPSPLEADDAGSLADAGTPRADVTADHCVAQPLTSDDRAIDVLFVMSTSASMATIDGETSPDSRWASASNAVRAFVARLNGERYGAGLLFFPLLVPTDGGAAVEACSSSDYEAPVVSVAPLDAAGAQAAAIDAALGAASLEGGNAMTAVLTGALKVAARVKGRTGHIVQTVLVTDGALDSCGGDVTSAAAAARTAFQTDRLETYVLGIGSNATNLDLIAAAGGTFHAYAATSNEGVASALSTLGATMRRCHFFFPMVLPPDAFLRMIFAVDYGKIGQELLSRFDDGSFCGPSAGWFLNSNVTPSYAIVCPTTCEALLQRPDREVSAMLGCF
jgi:hypothetical protein